MILRVATFNIRNGRAFDGWNSWPFRRRSLLDAIDDLDATVIGLQEVFAFQRRWLLRRLPDHTAHGLGRGRFRFGEQCPVLVRHEALEVIDHRTRWFGTDPDRRGIRLPGAEFPRIATTCSLRCRDTGETFTVTNTHLDAASAAHRRTGLEQLIAGLDLHDPQIVIGDLNAPVGDPLLDLLGEAGFRSAIPDDAGGSAHEFTGRTDGPRIDHIFVNERFDVRSGDVVHRPDTRPLASDHWPVVADLVRRG